MSAFGGRAAGFTFNTAKIRKNADKDRYIDGVPVLCGVLDGVSIGFFFGSLVLEEWDPLALLQSSFIVNIFFEA